MNATVKKKSTRVLMALHPRRERWEGESGLFAGTVCSRKSPSHKICPIISPGEASSEVRPIPLSRSGESPGETSQLLQEEPDFVSRVVEVGAYPYVAWTVIHDDSGVGQVPYGAGGVRVLDHKNG